ncbi:hypothetical protein GF342_00565 [Candidatus Woesearchaeota archaeon]|nr:hypothetical protein [Candidatus Woesearchaeota archaeon]
MKRGQAVWTVVVLIIVTVIVIGILQSFVGDDRRIGSADDDLLNGAVYILTDKEYTGVLSQNDTVDYVRFHLDNGSSWIVSVFPNESLDVSLEFFSFDAVPLTSEFFDRDTIDEEGIGGPEVAPYAFGSRENRTVFVMAVRSERGAGEYSLSISTRRQNDADSAADAGDTIETAVPFLSFDDNFLGYGDDADFYSLIVEEDSFVNVTPEDFDVSLHIFNEEFQDVTFALTSQLSVNQGGVNGSELVFLRPGSYLLLIAPQGFGRYTTLWYSASGDT